MIKRKGFFIPCVGTIIVAIGLMFTMNAVQPSLIAAAENNGLLFSFTQWLAGLSKGSVFWRCMWFLGDLTEGMFYRNIIAAVFMFVFTLIAWRMAKKGKAAGTGVAGNQCVFGWILAAQFLGIALNLIIWGGFAKSAGWIPSFVPMCCVAPPLILKFGGGLKKTVTAGILASLVAFPLAFYAMTYIGNPLGLPGFCGIALGMGTATIITTEICSILPWMKKTEEKSAEASDAQAPAPRTDTQLFFDRLFADSSELIFWGSSLGNMGMFLGLFISWFINPLHGVANGSLPLVICVHLCTTALAMFVWGPKYRSDGFCFTFSALIFSLAVTTTYTASPVIIIPSVILGVVLCPAIVDWVLKHLPIFRRWHAAVTVQLFIGVACGIWSLFVLHVLVPMVA